MPAPAHPWLDALPRLRGERALDVATGSGRFARSLAARYGAVWGLDRAEAIARAEADRHPRVTFVAGDAEALPFADGAFDFVGLSWALHHLARPTRVLDEMRRVLAPGGVLLIEEPIRVLHGDNRDAHVLAHELVARIDRARGRDHFPLYERLQVGSVIQGLGLVDLVFHPLLAWPGEADWGPDDCARAARPWIEKLQAAIADPALAPFHAAAHDLVSRLQAEGLRTGPVMVTLGTRPAAP